MTGPFDILIVGAGSAGSVLACACPRTPTSASGSWRRGAAPSDPDIANPRKWPALQDRPYDWAYRTTPQAGTAGRVHPWPRGRIVGGSSCLHAMAHVRGHAADFDAWATVTGSDSGPTKASCPPSAGSKLLGRREPSTAPGAHCPSTCPTRRSAPSCALHGGRSRPRRSLHRRAQRRPAERRRAPNSLTIRNDRRVSAADAFLTPVLGRPNLTLVTGVRVHRLAFDGDRVTGVEAEIDGRSETIAAGVVLLAMGAVRDAAPPDALRHRPGGGPQTRGHSVRHAREAVGANLHDHLLTAGNVYRARRPVPRRGCSIRNR